MLHRIIQSVFLFSVWCDYLVRAGGSGSALSELPFWKSIPLRMVSE
jgi:hypothetical protein